MNVTGLLLSIVGAADTARSPEVAPAGIVIVIDVALQESTVTSPSFRYTTLLPWEAPKPVPVITT